MIPALFNKTVITKILIAARAGNPPAECARLAGIPPITLRTWLDRGSDETSADYDQYSQFSQQFYENSNRLPALALRAVEDAMTDGDAQISLKFLQMHPSTATEFVPTRRSLSEINVQIDSGAGVRASIDASLKELLALHAAPVLELEAIEEGEVED